MIFMKKILALSILVIIRFFRTQKKEITNNYEIKIEIFNINLIPLKI